MEKYLGIKKISAKPMSRADYNKFRGWELPKDEEGSDKGFLVEYLDGGKANTKEYNGYVSWSPEEVFNKAYKPFQGLTFGDALEAAKAGGKIQRGGWNGKGIFVGVENPAKGSGMTTHFLYIDTTGLETANAEAPKVRVPWLASQTDMLAHDWTIIG